MYHVNPNTGIADNCSARTPENCPFGAGFHAETKQEIGEIYAEHIANDDDPETDLFFVSSSGKKSTDPIPFKTMGAWSVPIMLKGDDEVKNIRATETLKQIGIAAAGVFVGGLAMQQGLDVGSAIILGGTTLAGFHSFRNCFNIVKNDATISEQYELNTSATKNRAMRDAKAAAKNHPRPTMA